MSARPAVPAGSADGDRISDRNTARSGGRHLGPGNGPTGNATGNSADRHARYRRGPNRDRSGPRHQLRKGMRGRP
ncbi:hypothetical protein SAMN05216259_107192 [Actinacidiphila guanduensis]|uniref:Uncharacterized protein n=1 Tax=Actinacidiphila guanduensis TaxID=310781 RepID=A0A1H0GNF8_9ACTN|nr:hypothetical protein SAMN05216259_107192 [Actinacidiphila guanduensis]